MGREIRKRIWIWYLIAADKRLMRRGRRNGRVAWLLLVRVR
jgi:hypothetical protein